METNTLIIEHNASNATHNGEHNNAITNKNVFDEKALLHDLKHYLPTQTPLKDFIHHNSLHALQHLKFFDAIFTAAQIFGYQTTFELNDYRQLYATNRIKKQALERIIVELKGKENLDFWLNNVLQKPYNCNVEPRVGKLRTNWKNFYKIDIDNYIQPLLFRVLSSYLDQGIALHTFPLTEGGFLANLQYLEKNSFVSFFKTQQAKQLLLQCTPNSIEMLLNKIVGKPEYYYEYIIDQQFSHRGWAGMVAVLEETPQAILNTRTISLQEVIIFELLLEIDALTAKFGTSWLPLTTHINQPPVNIFAPVPITELQDVLKIWQLAFEWSYYDEIMAGIVQLQNQKTDINAPNPNVSFQAIFCIDERECSLRRHVEFVDKNSETLGSPGFFGVEFYFKAEGAKVYEKLCPAPVTPKYLIKQKNTTHSRHEQKLYKPQNQTLIRGFVLSIVMGFVAMVQLVLDIFRPKMTAAISDAFAHMENNSELEIENTNPQNREDNLQLGFTVEEMATRVQNLLSGIGLLQNFAPIVYVVAHGSSSANNPHHGAHDCGACSGRPGSVNARVFAFMANHPKVREILKTKGIVIPTQTQFVGSLHDTASDQMDFYDEKILNAENKKRHAENKIIFEKALDLNAQERSRRFASINIQKPIKNVRKAILNRSVSFFEPRPELGHGTNALCVIGRRSLTKGVFLDRRAFLNSYNYATDPQGELLKGIMAPIGPVCGGINLEYYFSRMDNQKLGAGTKLPHNVVGLIGVANGADGDLKPGLPLQMIEVHDPVRLLVIVEHFPEVLLQVIKSNPAIYEWYANEWIHLTAVHPETKQFFYFKNNEFVPYTPFSNAIQQVSNIQDVILGAKEMATNYIVEATKENLPVYIH